MLELLIITDYSEKHLKVEMPGKGKRQPQIVCIGKLKQSATSFYTSEMITIKMV